MNFSPIAKKVKGYSQLHEHGTRYEGSYLIHCDCVLQSATDVVILIRVSLIVAISMNGLTDYEWHYWFIDINDITDLLVLPIK